ncbi:APC family permease [Mycobacterium sp. 94-17]|uniref:APC family permease n=1 Tax=Mycobacterium sp. 94-17 TaxID=2986147 RepID=UPI003B63BD11
MTESLGGIPLSFTDRCKRILLGEPLTTDRLDAERLSNPVALGALAPDAISSTAYGPEQIMIELLPAAGMAAFALLLPITGVILVILALVSVSYRQVVTAYTRPGGSYLVARENFGPRVAQVAAAALVIDYVVTVAVQPAAATVAVVSAVPALRPYHLEITLAAVVLICLVNLRGLRRSGRMFAITTYAFVAMITATILTGLVRELAWGLPKYDPHHLVGAVPVHQGGGLVMGATVLIVLRAFANGGTSLTGVEAVSNSTNVFKKPEGINARRVLTAMVCMLGFLLAGVAWLAHVTHAVPYLDEYPSMLSEITRAVFGDGAIGKVLYFMVQASTAAILFTGCNTSFNGFPALAGFVAEDRFLPRPLSKRGHRLVLSNGILTLTALAVTLLLITEAKVSALVPFYAIGVFTAFAIAGYGMAKHHLTRRGPGWRPKVAMNVAAGVMSTIVVGIFVVAKFTEGAWLIVIIFPLLVLALMRLNKKYRDEASVLEMSRTEMVDLSRYQRLQVLVFVDTIDLAEIEAVRMGNGLQADELTAVHFVIDADHAMSLRERWNRFEHDTPLRLINCLDRHLSRAAHEFVVRVLAEHPDSRVTVLLPRRTYSPLLGRMLHDRTADRMARAVSRIRNATAIIMPYDIESRIARVAPHGFEPAPAKPVENDQDHPASVARVHTVT